VTTGTSMGEDGVPSENLHVDSCVRPISSNKDMMEYWIGAIFTLIMHFSCLLELLGQFMVRNELEKSTAYRT
jgi:hypothetical protein